MHTETDRLVDLKLKNNLIQKVKYLMMSWVQYYLTTYLHLHTRRGTKTTLYSLFTWALWFTWIRPLSDIQSEMRHIFHIKQLDIQVLLQGLMLRFALARNLPCIGYRLQVAGQPPIITWPMLQWAFLDFKPCFMDNSWRDFLWGNGGYYGLDECFL